MGRLRAIGMRARVPDPDALVINTCSGNDTSDVGDLTHWTWANPTNRMIAHKYADITAVSVECLWQGTKVFSIRNRVPQCDPAALQGDWRRGKGKKPIGAYTGMNTPLIMDVGEARRKIYVPAYKAQLMYWLGLYGSVQDWVKEAKTGKRDVYLRDHTVGHVIDSPVPMSHAWLLIQILEGRI